MSDRLKPRLNDEVSELVGAAGRRLRIFKLEHTEVPSLWQIALPVVRPQVIATSLALPRTSALTTDPLFGSLRRSHAGTAK